MAASSANPPQANAISANRSPRLREARLRVAFTAYESAFQSRINRAGLLRYSALFQLGADFFEVIFHHFLLHRNRIAGLQGRVLRYRFLLGLFRVRIIP